MKNVLFIFLFGLMLGLTSTLKAQNCSEGLSLINKLWENFDPLDLVGDKEAVKEQTSALKKELSSFVSLKKDAPRMLPISGNKKKINLKPNRKRIFVTKPLKQETLTLTINRSEIESEATVTICKHTLKGKTDNVDKVTLPSGGESTFTIPIEGITGTIVSINVTNTSTSKIQYTIAAN